jgi:phosphoribosyl-AMP cyclohydrolase
MTVLPEWELAQVARFPRLRALAWSRDYLYASRGYQVLRAKISQDQMPTNDLAWQPVASFRPAWWRRGSATMRLSSRLFRDGCHALAILPSGGIVGAVPGAIVTLRPGENEFRTTHTITRGTRPLHIASVPSGTVYWGEYFDNAARDEVHIYASTDGGVTWNVALTFPKGAIRHVHNIVYDLWGDCLWVLTGDYGNECRILRAACDFRQVDVVLQGDQQARAVALVPTEDGLYFASDTPLEANFIYRMDRQGGLRRLADVSSSSIYGCRVRDCVFFSTMVEPSAVNSDRHVRIYGSSRHAEDWRPLLAWQKDRWPMGFLQYGNALMPDGENSTNYLAVTTVAVEADDQCTLLYALRT